MTALRRLDASLPADASLAGTSPFLGRYLGHRYVDLPDAFGLEIADPRLWFARVEPLLRRSHMVYVVAGATDLRDCPPSLLKTGDPVPWLHLVEEKDGVAVWQVRFPAYDRTVAK